MDDNRNIGDIEFPPGVKEISADMTPVEMAKALQKCCKFFSHLEQDEEEMKRIYLPFVKYIVQDEFLNEVNDENCQIHIGCILADVFRLHSPENPFQNLSKVKDIFLFLIRQLRQLKDTRGPYYIKAYYILENVAAIKSFNICIDLEETEVTIEVFTLLFKTLFKTISPSHDQQVRSHMLNIMSFAITDSGSVPSELLDVILECLLDKTKKLHPSAYELAKELLIKTSSVVKQYIMVFFQNVLLLNEGNKNKLSPQWRKLIPELYKISPSLLQHTIPQLEMKLKVDNTKERLQVVLLLSEMFSEKNTNLAAEYPAMWNSFLSRFNDIDAEVRVACVCFCRDLLRTHGKDVQLSKDVIPYFKSRRHDMNDNVRVAVVKTIRDIALHNLKSASDEFLEFLEQRVKDKKWRVRESSITAMADIYKKYCTGESASRLDIKRLHSFKNTLLHLCYRQNSDDYLLLEKIMVNNLIPYSLSNTERMKVLLELYCTVDELAAKAFVEMFKKQELLRNALKKIVTAFDTEDAQERDDVISSMVHYIVVNMPVMAQGGKVNVNKFIQVVHDDAKMRQWLSYISGNEYNCQKIAVAVRDLMNKMNATAGVNKQAKATVQQLLSRSVIGSVTIDATSFKSLFDLIKECLNGDSDVDELNSEESQHRAMDLMALFAKVSPHIITSKGFYEDLLNFLDKTREERMIEQSLITLERTAHIMEENFPDLIDDLIEILKNKAKTGNAKEAKLAISCISQFKSHSKSALLQVFNHCKETALSEGTDFLMLQTMLTSLGCIGELLPAETSQLSTIVSKVVVKKIMMSKHNSTPAKSKKKEAKWCEKYELSRETKAKIAGMKCMVRWLSGIRSNDGDYYGSTLRLMQHVLHNQGDLMNTGLIPKAEKAHIRLHAACSIIKLAQITELKSEFLPKNYQALALLLSDPVLEVRRIFLRKLFQQLLSFALPISFLSLFAMVSQEASKEQRGTGTYWYNQLIKRIRSSNPKTKLNNSHVVGLVPECMLPFLIYLLANDSDYGETFSKKDLARNKDCIQFVLDPILTKNHPESFGLIKKIADNIKRTKNNQDPENTQKNEKMYIVCDLIIQHVLHRSSQHAVAVIEPVDKVAVKFIPSLFYTTPLGPPNKKMYLPKEFCTNIKLIPTPAITEAMGGDKYRKKHAHHAVRMILEQKRKREMVPLTIFGGETKRVQPIPTVPKPQKEAEKSDIANQSSNITPVQDSLSPPPPLAESPENISEVLGEVGTDSESELTESSASIATPMSTPTASRKKIISPTPASSSQESTPVQAVRTSGRKRKPRNLSPLPFTKRGKNTTNTSTDTDMSGYEENAGKSTQSSSASSKSSPIAKKRNVIARAYVKTAVRKTLGDNNNATSESSEDSAVRRSGRVRRKKVK